MRTLIPVLLLSTLGFACEAPVRCSEDAQCPRVRPVCDEKGACVPCAGQPTARATRACAAHGGGRCARDDGPFDEGGACVACLVASDCAEGQGCWFGSCVAACARHGDCESAACTFAEVPGAEAPRGTSHALGLCVPTSSRSFFDEILYVDRAASGCAQGRGTKEDPLCEVADALGSLGAKLPSSSIRRSTIKVAFSQRPYAPLALPDRPRGVLSAARVLVLGSDGEAAQPVLGNAPGRAAVLVGAGRDVILEGLALAESEQGLACIGNGDARAKAQVVRSHLRGHSRTGIVARRCDLAVERCAMYENNDGVLLAQNDVRYRIVNTFAFRNSTRGGSLLSFDNDAVGTFRFNTIANNSPGAGGTLDCGWLDRRIEDSIFVGNGLVRGTSSQMSGACVLGTTVLDPGDGAEGGQRGTPQFVGFQDLRLVPDAVENAACCLDRAAALTDGAAWTDYYGTFRPLGDLPDVGAQEVGLSRGNLFQSPGETR